MREVHQIRRIPGEAGQVRYSVDITTRGGGIRHFDFGGNIFVGPVVVTSSDEIGHWDRVVVDDPRQFGEFVSAEWVRRYLAAWDDGDASGDACATKRRA
ncbi:hypothetical protein [Mycolicibacterium sp.]|uniref:hypothetical protein n=1 Tax=Mycolicibacterium sp. TaxID=2320850 RepID=UPI001A2C8F27|nr:hypothetical protein [Mycolicibacterium sp.]MBJ7339594.1 hypothetical protein [Mycolicibacterium sp.]